MPNTNALGMIETKGLVGAIEAADAMVKVLLRFLSYAVCILRSMPFSLFFSEKMGTVRHFFEKKMTILSIILHRNGFFMQKPPAGRLPAAQMPDSLVV